MTRLGYYVEDKYFGNNKHQAIAFAKFRAQEWGRSLEVIFVGDQNVQTIIGVAEPDQETQS